jgi:hypothetical protein
MLSVKAGSRTRYCPGCEVTELRCTEPCYPLTVTVKGQRWFTWEDTWVSYLDHSAGSYPSPG